jgi:alkylation response protein AidB-like acyl-CoA dehydrogenase
VDFGDSPAEAAFRAELRAWITDQLPFPAIPDEDEERVDYLTAWQRRLFEAGWVGVTFPQEYGGRGLDLIYEAIVLDELGSAGAPPVWHYGYVAQVLLMYGTEEQKRRFVPSAIRGEERWCQGFSEPDAGSDLGSLKTRAVRDGDHYVVTGQKVWTSEAHWAQWCLLLARSEPDQPTNRAMTMFVLPMDSPGLTVRPFRQITGSLEFAEVFFDGVRIPVSQRVGEPGSGWSIAMSTVALERGPADVGFIADFRRTLQAMAQQAASGSLRREGGLGVALASAYVDVEVLRLQVLRALSRRMKGEGSEAEASIEKLLMTRTDQGLAHAAMDLAGSAPLLGEAPALLHQYLWSRAASVYGGSSQIQRTIVANTLLGLPREPRAKE